MASSIITDSVDAAEHFEQFVAGASESLNRVEVQLPVCDIAGKVLNERCTVTDAGFVLQGCCTDSD